MIIINWIDENKEWLFSGIGIVVASLIIKFFFNRNRKNQKSSNEHNGMKPDLKDMSEAEMEILKKFYIPQISEYTSGKVTISEDNDNIYLIEKLTERHILAKQTEMDRIENYNGYGVEYSLRPEAREKMNKINFKKPEHK